MSYIQDLSFLFVLMIISIAVYFLVTIEESPKPQVPVLVKHIQKFEQSYVLLKTIPKDREFVYKHEKLTKRAAPGKNLFTTDVPMYLSLNHILGHFYLSEDPNKLEILKLNYIPDNFNFNAFNVRSNHNPIENKNLLPSKLAQVSDEIDNIIDNLEPDIESTRTPVSFKRNRITLKTVSDYYLNVKYTVFPKPEYDVNAVNKNIIESILKLRQISVVDKKKKKIIYYLKFSNDYYLCINKNGVIFASPDKNKIFYFDIVVVTKEQYTKIHSKPRHKSCDGLVL